MPRLLIFNPSNDMALAAGVRQYVPPKTIQAMEQRMASFPLTYAQPGDVVLTDWTDTYHNLCRKCGAVLEPSPWGWSLAIKLRLLRFGVPEHLMPTDEELERWRTLSSRETAAGYITQLLNDFSISADEPQLVGHAMTFLKTLPSTPLQPGQWIFKSPWSCSGRGVFVSTDEAQTLTRLRGYLHRQSGFLMDRFYDRLLDCALEYDLDREGQAHFLGFSVFNTEGNGRYGHNYIESNDSLLQRIVDALGGGHAARRLILRLVEYHREALAALLGKIYRGPVGIDMLVVSGNTPHDTPRLHPCIEINLRMNMGIAAIEQYKKEQNTYLSADKQNARS